MKNQNNPSVILSLEPLGLAFELPLAPLLIWWQNLKDGNQARRNSEAPQRFLRQCRACGADFSHIAYVDGSRICMVCRHELSRE